MNSRRARPGPPGRPAPGAGPPPGPRTGSPARSVTARRPLGVPPRLAVGPLDEVPASRSIHSGRTRATTRAHSRSVSTSSPAITHAGGSWTAPSPGDGEAGLAGAQVLAALGVPEPRRGRAGRPAAPVDGLGRRPARGLRRMPSERPPRAAGGQVLPLPHPQVVEELGPAHPAELVRRAPLLAPRRCPHRLRKAEVGVRVGEAGVQLGRLRPPGRWAARAGPGSTGRRRSPAPRARSRCGRPRGPCGRAGGRRAAGPGGGPAASAGLRVTPP